MLQNIESSGVPQRPSPAFIAEKVNAVAAHRREEAERLHSTEERTPDLWIHRDVIGLSYPEITETARLFNRDTSRGKAGRYTLSLVVPGELIQASKYSNMSDLEKDKVVEDMMHNFPDSTRHPVAALGGGLKQFRDYIAIEASYDAYEEERAFILEHFSHAFGINHTWDMLPHISVVHGKLSKISNRDEIEAAIPTYIQLSEVIKDTGTHVKKKS